MLILSNSMTVGATNNVQKIPYKELLIYQVIQPYFLKVLVTYGIFFIIVLMTIYFLGVLGNLVFIPFLFLSHLIFHAIFSNFIKEVKERFYSRLFLLKHEDFEGENAAEIIGNLDKSVQDIRSVISSMFSVVLLTPFIIFLSYHFVRMERGPVLLLGGTFLLIISFLLLYKKTDQSTRDLLKYNQKFQSLLVPSLQNIKAIEVNLMQPQIWNILSNNLSNQEVTAKKLEWLQSTTTWIPIILFGSVLIIGAVMKVLEKYPEIKKKVEKANDEAKKTLVKLQEQEAKLQKEICGNKTPESDDKELWKKKEKLFELLTSIEVLEDRLRDFEEFSPIKIKLGLVFQNYIFSGLGKLGNDAVVYINTENENENENELIKIVKSTLLAPINENCLLFVAVFISIRLCLLLRAFMEIYTKTSYLYESFGHLRASKYQEQQKYKVEKIKNIKIRNLTYKRGDKTILRNWNLEFKEGEVICVVGLSGLGKTTLLDIICYLLTTYTGDVFINNINLRDCDIQSLREQMSYMTQRPILFDLNVMEQFELMGIPFRENEMHELLEKVNLQFLTQKPYKRLGDGGGRLSGGQQQRLCIARTLLKKSSLYLCDETTGALDKFNTTQVWELLFRVFEQQKSMAIIVDHGLQMLEKCHKVLYFKKDGTCAFAAHAELVATDEEYQEFVGYKNTLINMS